MYGLVLEGGGARGAYHIGALKALLENNYKIAAVTGTSIGAINGAMIAQHDFDRLYEIWKNASFSTLMDVDTLKMDRFITRKIDISLIRYLSGKLKGTIANGGIDTYKMRKLFEDVIDEEKVRKSDIEFGLVTVCLTDRKPQELFIEDIPEGSLIDYLLASSRLPIFKSQAFENKHYIDGGFYNNCPFNMLDEKGYENVIIIRTGSKGKIKGLDRIKTPNMKVTIIHPVDELPGLMNFSNKTINDMMELGYYDALKVIKNLDGVNSYIVPENEERIFNMLSKYPKDAIEEMAELLGIKSRMFAHKLLFEKIIPSLALKLGYKNVSTYKETIYMILEYIAQKESINLHEVYVFDELLAKVQSKIRLKDKGNIDKAIYKFVKNINMSLVD